MKCETFLNETGVMDVNILKSSDKLKEKIQKTKKNKVLKTEFSNLSHELLNKKKLFPQI